MRLRRPNPPWSAGVFDMTQVGFEPHLPSILRHLNLIGTNAPLSFPELQIELAWGEPEEGPNCARLYPVSQIAAAAEQAALVNRNGCNVYVGITLKKGDAATNRRTRNSDAAMATCVAVDIDGNLVASAGKLPQGIKPQLLVVTGSIPQTRGHLWFGLQPSGDLDLWDEATSRAVVSCDGDMNARGRSRVMRLGGTVSYPSLSKRSRSYVVEPVIVHVTRGPTYLLPDLLSLLPPVQSTQSAFHGLTRSRNVRPRTAADVTVVKSALDSLPDLYADDHDLWLRSGFSLHSFDAGSQGLALFKKFSGRCPGKASLTNFDRKWASFAPKGGQRPITLGWLFAQAKLHGWQGSRLSPRRRRRK